jgi:hypothetical protein
MRVSIYKNSISVGKKTQFTEKIRRKSVNIEEDDPHTIYKCLESF